MQDTGSAPVAAQRTRANTGTGCPGTNPLVVAALSNRSSLVAVLELVDQQVAVPRAQGLANVGLLVQQVTRQGQQVIEVHGVAVVQVLGVVAEDRRVGALRTRVRKKGIAEQSTCSSLRYPVIFDR